jgi:release factor glutamine methyltransferase
MQIPKLFIAAADRLLKPGGYFIMEHHEKQGELVREALSMQFSNTQTHADLNGRDRFTSARKR